jgi:Sulfatase
VFIGERVSQWLEQHRDRNFFLYLHALDPHAPFDPPQPWRDQALAQLPKDGTTPMRWDRDLDPDWSKEPTLEGRRLLYEAEIAHNDAVVEQFFRRLDALGLSQNTLVVMTADHGEYLGERNFFGNRLWTHRPPGFLPGTHVPLMMVYPKRFKEPKRIKDPVQLIDVMPTVLELAGVERGDLLLQGHSLLGLIDGARPDAWRDRVIVSEEPTAMLKDNPCSCGSLYFRDWHLLSSSWTWPGRLLHYPNLQTLLTSSAYRMAEDSRSERLVASSLPDLLLRWRQHAALGELREANMTVWRRLTDGEGSSAMIDPETVEELRGLGYVN